MDRICFQHRLQRLIIKVQLKIDSKFDPHDGKMHLKFMKFYGFFHPSVSHKSSFSSTESRSWITRMECYGLINFLGECDRVAVNLLSTPPRTLTQNWWFHLHLRMTSTCLEMVEFVKSELLNCVSRTKPKFKNFTSQSQNNYSNLGCSKKVLNTEANQKIWRWTYFGQTEIKFPFFKKFWNCPRQGSSLWTIVLF